MGYFSGFFKDSEFEAKTRFLRGVGLFSDLSDREMGFLAQSLFEKTYLEGDLLFEEGDIGRALFIVENGSVELSKRGKGGQMQRLAVAKPGDFFGEMALLEEMPRSASARAVEESKVYLLYKAKLDALLMSRPKAAVPVLLRLAQLLSSRVRHASERLVSGHGVGDS